MMSRVPVAGCTGDLGERHRRRTGVSQAGKDTGTICKERGAWYRHERGENTHSMHICMHANTPVPIPDIASLPWC